MVGQGAWFSSVFYLELWWSMSETWFSKINSSTRSLKIDSLKSISNWSLLNQKLGSKNIDSIFQNRFPVVKFLIFLVEVHLFFFWWMTETQLSKIDSSNRFSKIDLKLLEFFYHLYHITRSLVPKIQWSNFIGMCNWFFGGRFLSHWAFHKVEVYMPVNRRSLYITVDNCIVLGHSFTYYH